MRVRITTTAKGLAAHSRIDCYAKALQCKGFAVEIISAFDMPRLSSQQLKATDKQPIHYKSLLKDKTFSLSVLNHLWAIFVPYYLSLYTVFRPKPYEVCLLYMSSVWPKIIILFFLKYIFRKKTILELNEYPLATRGSKLTRIPAVKTYLRQLTFKVVFPLTSGFIVISESLKKVVKQKVSHPKILKTPILVEDLPNLVREKPKIKDNNLYLFHAGSLSVQKDGIIKVFEAFAQAHKILKDKYKVKLNFVITNKKTQPQTWHTIEEILKKYNLEDNLKITGFLSDEQLKDYQENALALLVNKPESFQNKYNFPTKLSSYLISGRPVIVAAKNLELNLFLKHHDNAFVVEPDDVDEMAQAIVYTYENPEMVNQITTNALKVVQEHFYFKSQSHAIGDFIQNL